MKRLATLALTTLLAASTALPAVSTPAEARNRGAKVAAGVVLGAAALAIIANSNSARASNYGNYGHRRGHGRYENGGFIRTCRKWYNQCSDGNNYACEKYETRGCTE